MYTVHLIWKMNNYITLTVVRPTWPETFHNSKIYMYIYISIISGKYRSLFLTKKPITLAYIASWSIVRATCDK